MGQDTTEERTWLWKWKGQYTSVVYTMRIVASSGGTITVSYVKTKPAAQETDQ